MKINLFIDCLGAGGAQRQLTGLAVLLKEKGYNVKVCSYHPLDFYKSYLDENNIPNEIIPNAANTKKRIFAVRNYFKKEKPDWVIAYQETPSVVACAAKLLGCTYKLIVSERNTTQVYSRATRMRFWLYRAATAIVPNSYSQEQYILKKRPAYKERLYTITNFVDLERFQPDSHTLHNVPQIMVAASMWESKNAKALIKAIARLVENGHDVIVMWYGRNELSTAYENECDDLIRDLNLHDKFRILPKERQIELRYKEADFFCLPSFFEGTPNVICEAISSGLPVLCSDVCDNSIYVHEGENGFLFDPQNIDSIVVAFTKALSLSPSEYQRARETSRMIAEEKLDKNVFVNKYIDILRHDSK